MKKFTKLFLLALCSWFLFLWFSNAQTDWSNPNIEALEHSSSQCGWSAQCLEPPHSLPYVLFHAFLGWCIITLILCLIIFLIYFIIFKHKKDNTPFKHTIKKTCILWITIFIFFPIIFIVLFYFLYW